MFLGVSPYWLLFGEGPEQEAPQGLAGYQIPTKREALKAPIILADETLQALGISPEHFGCFIAKDPAFKSTYKPITPPQEKICVTIVDSFSPRGVTLVSCSVL